MRLILLSKESNMKIVFVNGVIKNMTIHMVLEDFALTHVE